ncbi:MAG TPA: hypothetical protein VIH18_26430 [Candidatus Binatia bacterium]
MKTSTLMLAGTLVCGLWAPGFAQTATQLNTEATRMDSLASNQGQSKVIGKISGDFSGFLGSDSEAVVTGLRNGTPIKLTSTTTTPSTTPGAPPVTTTNTTIINPPTGKMGHGNVYISLALAKQQLGAAGITEPTPQQLQAALTGGTITTGTGPNATTTMDGILTMRSQNMGWGQIAQKLGYKLGPVISGMKSANHNLSSTTATTPSGSTTTAAGAQSNKTAQSGIVSGSGKSQGNGGHGIVDAKGSKGSSSSIVTASGASGGKSASGIVTSSGRGLGSAQSHGYGRGIVSGSGHAAGSSSGTVSRGSGNGAAHGKGHSK